MNTNEVLRLALETLEVWKGYMPALWDKTDEQAITALRQALEQPAQKCSYPYCGCNSKAWCKVERNEALDKMAENARELGLDYEPAQEPVAYMGTDIEGNPNKFRLNPFGGCVPLYKKPQSVKVWDAEGYGALCQELEGWKAKAQRTWVGLNPADRGKCLSAGDAHGWIGVMEATEAKLKEKNR